MLSLFVCPAIRMIGQDNFLTCDNNLFTPEFDGERRGTPNDDRSIAIFGIANLGRSIGFCEIGSYPDKVVS